MADNWNQTMNALLDAAAGSENAAEDLYKTGQFLLDGQFGDDSIPYSWKFFLRSAQLGHTKAMLALSRCYEQGQGGVPQDSGLARQWLKKAADAGDITAMQQAGKQE